MSTDLASPKTSAVPRQAETDHQMVTLWVNRSNSPNTMRNYQRQAERFLDFVDRPLAKVRVMDVQAYLLSLKDKAPATGGNAAAAIKSLLTLAYETGYIHFNPGKAIWLCLHKTTQGRIPLIPTVNCILNSQTRQLRPDR